MVFFNWHIEFDGTAHIGISHCGKFKIAIYKKVSPHFLVNDGYSYRITHDGNVINDSGFTTYLSIDEAKRVVVSVVSLRSVF